MTRIKARLTYANVMVTLLTLVVLGGGVAYATTIAAKNSVTSKSIRDRTVKPRDLAAKSAIANGIDPDAVRTYVGPPADVAPNNTRGVTINCPGNDVALGGGAKWTNNPGGPIVSSHPDPGSAPGGGAADGWRPTGWDVSVVNQSLQTTRSFTPYVVCVAGS